MFDFSKLILLSVSLVSEVPFHRILVFSVPVVHLLPFFLPVLL